MQGVGPAGGRYLRPTPCTLHFAPYTLHPAPCILHPAPCTLNTEPVTPHQAVFHFPEETCDLMVEDFHPSAPAPAPPINMPTSKLYKRMSGQLQQPAATGTPPPQTKPAALPKGALRQTLAQVPLSARIPTVLCDLSRPIK